MRRRTLTLAAVWLTTGVVCAWGQLGLREEEFFRRWGQPFVPHPGSYYFRTVTFTNEGSSVEAGLVNGVVEHMVYRKPRMKEEDVRVYLQANAGGAEWQPWSSPQPSEAGTRSIWMRSDEVAEAVFEGNTFTISSGVWNRRQRDAPDAGGQQPLPVTIAAEPSVSNAAPVVDSRIAGYWLIATNAGTAVALQFRPDASMSWMLVADEERREFRSPYRLLKAGDRAGIEILDGTTNENVTGLFEFVDVDTMRFTRRKDDGGPLAGFLTIGPKETLTFRRTAKLPEWKPRRPTGLPAKGDSKAKVFEMLGRATGTMNAGRREILLYRWGQIVLLDGRVVSVE